MEWKPVKGWENFYEVSSDGQIRKKDGNTIGQWKNDQGYYLARLSNPRKAVRVHRVVADSFIEKPEGKDVVNHLDCNPANNRIENLEWCTQKENILHSIKLGRYSNDYWRGKKGPNCSLTINEVVQIKSLRKEGLSASKIADKVGTNKKTVLNILNGKTYKWAA